MFRNGVSGFRAEAASSLLYTKFLARSDEQLCTKWPMSTDLFTKLLQSIRLALEASKSIA